jgi:hypothetical protein
VRGFDDAAPVLGVDLVAVVGGGDAAPVDGGVDDAVAGVGAAGGVDGGAEVRCDGDDGGRLAVFAGAGTIWNPMPSVRTSRGVDSSMPSSSRIEGSMTIANWSPTRVR